MNLAERASFQTFSVFFQIQESDSCNPFQKYFSSSTLDCFVGKKLQNTVKWFVCTRPKSFHKQNSIQNLKQNRFFFLG